MLPYHLGALEALQYNDYLTAENPIAGSSAGAIATAVHACQLDHRKILQATIDISDHCKEMGGARGRLLPLLREQLNNHVNEEQIEAVTSREGRVGIAYRELFPFNRPVLQTEFEHKEDLMNAVCSSSMFPFFATNLPFHIDTSGRLPRIVVDGYFTVPRERFGCPDFAAHGVEVERTVAISVFPRAIVGMTAFDADDCISPSEEEESNSIERLIRIATKPSSKEELIGVYEAGWKDAEEWCGRQDVKAKDTIRNIALMADNELN